MSVTCTIRAGTCRGVVFRRMCRRIAIGLRLGRATAPSRSLTNSTIRSSPSHCWPMTRLSSDLRQLLDLAIDLRGADADAAGIQHGVGSAVDDHAVVLGQLARSRRASRRRGTARSRRRGTCGRPDRSRSRPASTGTASCRPAPPSRRAHGLPVLVEHLDLHAQRAALDLAAPHRADRIAADEAAHDVGAAGNRRQVDVALHVLVDEVEALRRQRRSGRRHRPHAVERVRLARAQAGLRTASMNLADVPNSVIRVSSANVNSVLPSG